MANITLSGQITNIMFIIFNVIGQEKNTFTGDFANKSSKGPFKVTGTGNQCNAEEIITLINDAAASIVLEFKKFDPTDKENWYGTCAPYLDFFTAFKLRATEPRVGHTNIPVRKEEDTYAIPEVKYGLTVAHHVLLEGCTFQKREAQWHKV